jgi:predicted ATPase/DNA-binding winged helix-turn-helix (wHTH) protein
VDRGAFVFGPFRLIPMQRILLEHGKPLRLSSRAVDILTMLAERAGETVEKGELIAGVWPDTVVEEGALRVHVALLRKALGDDPGGKSYITNIPGRGYSLVAPVMREPEQPPPSAEPRANGIVPRPLSRLIGRDDTVAAVVAQVPRRRLLSIVGPGGIGKTTVAIAVAQAVSDRFTDGVWFVGLAAVPDADLVPIALGTVLGISPAGTNPIAGLIAWLRDRRALIVLDSCEHVIGAAASLAETLLKAAPNLSIIATSREPLRAEGEWLHRLASLETPRDAGDLTAEDALRYSAVQLFNERATATESGFTLLDSDVPAVLEICRRLDGVPLALELAAARVDAFGLKDLAARLDHRFSVLTRGHRTALPRQQTLRATMDWSYDLLPETEQIVLRRLAVFYDDFTMAAAAQVASDSVITAAHVVEAVANLIEKSLVASEIGDDRHYLRLLDTMRAYALEKLAASGEARQGNRRHAIYQCQLFEGVEAKAAAVGMNDWQVEFNRQIGNLRGALNGSFAADGDPALGGTLAAAAVDFWLAESLLSECCDWCGRALAQLGEAAGTRREMVLQSGLGLALVFTRGTTAAAQAALTRALGLARVLGDIEHQKRALFGLWLFATRAVEFRGSLALARQYEDLAADGSDPSAISAADWMVGISQSFLGEHVAAGARLQRALDRYPAGAQCRDIVRFGADLRAIALSYRAVNLWLQGFLEQALETGREAVEVARAANHPVSLCLALSWPHSRILLRSGDLAAAGQCIAELIHHAEEHGLVPYHAFGVCANGSLMAERGDSAAGIRLLRSGLAEMRQAQYYLFYPIFQAELAYLLASAGQMDEALAAIDEAERCALDTDYPWMIPEVLRIKGEVLRLQPSADRATIEGLFMRSMDQARRQHAAYWQLRSAVSLVEFCRDQGRSAAARERLASVYGQFTEGFDTLDLLHAARLLEQSE